MPKSALAIYEKAIAPHRAARDAAKATAEAERLEACQQAHAKFLEQVAPYRAAYDAAVGEAYAHCLTAQSDAERAYEAAVADPRTAFDEALAAGEDAPEVAAVDLTALAAGPVEPVEASPAPEPAAAGKGRRPEARAETDAGADPAGADSPLF